MTELPNGWVDARLADVADVRLGRQRSPKNHVGARMRPYVRAANIRWSGLDLTDVKEMNFSESESQIYELRRGDVLVAEASGSASEVGKPAIWRDEIPGCCFQNTIIRVRSRGPLPEYLRYWILAEARSGRIGAAAPGVGIHHIGSTRLMAWSVAVPPLEEQARIVELIEEQLSRLDAADATLAAATRRIEAARSSAVIGSIGERWPYCRIDQLSNGTPHALAIGPFGSNLKVSDYTEDGVPLIFVRDIRRRQFGDSRTRYIATAKADALAAHVVRPGDLLITKMGAPPGDAAVYPNSRPFGVLTADCIKVSLGEQAFGPFCALAFQLPAVRKQIASITSGVAQKKVSLARFRAVELPLPPIDEQRQIVARVEAQLSVFAALSAAVERARSRSRILGRAILEGALGGEMTPQDPRDEPASVLLERIRANRAAPPARAHRRQVTM
jgi:type I restriction enzyme, S subunit